PSTGLHSDQAEARLNGEVILRRTEGQQRIATETAWRSAPFLLAAALFLLGVLRGWRRQPVRVLFVELFVLAVALLLAFWLFPMGLMWFHDMTHRPLGYVAFYAGSVIVAYLGFRYRSIVYVLWFAG